MIINNNMIGFQKNWAFLMVVSFKTVHPQFTYKIFYKRTIRYFYWDIQSREIVHQSSIVSHESNTTARAKGKTSNQNGLCTSSIQRLLLSLDTKLINQSEHQTISTARSFFTTSYALKRNVEETNVLYS